MVFESASEEDTNAYAKQFADTLNSSDVVMLRGDLGAGKSVFSRAVIRHLCDMQDLEVPSPTFTLVQNYDAPIGTIWHFDLYRLSDHSEIYELGWEEAITDGIVLVEWPERLGVLTPKNYIDVTLTLASSQPNHRTIEVIRHD